MNKLLVRTISGGIYVALIVLSLTLGGHWAFPLVCCILGSLAVCELDLMALSSYSRAVVVNDAIIVLVLLLTAGHIVTTDVAFPVLFAAILIRGVVQLGRPVGIALSESGRSALSVLYIGIGLVSSLLIWHVSAQLMLAVFIIIWVNDTGAYLVGCSMGKHRLCESISPKKSWEGFYGGLAFSILAGILLGMVLPELSEFSIVETAILGAVICIASTFGDLFESVIKRSCGVKDSGHVMPGHGGILDRIDSLIFAAPTILMLILLRGI